MRGEIMKRHDLWANRFKRGAIHCPCPLVERKGHRHFVYGAWYRFARPVRRVFIVEKGVMRQGMLTFDIFVN